MPKVGNLSPGKCPPSPFPSQTPLLVTCPLVKAHTKLHICISQRGTEIEITVRYRYAASIGSVVWALTKRESDREGMFDWGRWRSLAPWLRLTLNCQYRISVSRSGIQKWRSLWDTDMRLMAVNGRGCLTGKVTWDTWPGVNDLPSPLGL